MIGIYKITNPNNKIYIGQSINIENRFYSYGYLKCKGQKKLFNSFKKYGIENHEFEVLEIIEDKSLLNDRENFYFSYYKDLGYNMMNLIVPNGYNNSFCSKDTKDLISLANSKSIIQYSKDGSKIKYWNSIKEASKNLDISYSSINNCCRNKQKIAGGYIWRYEDSKDQSLPNFERKKIVNRKKRNIRLKRPIFQYSKEGVFIKEWFNAKIASEDLQINNKAINECVSGRTKSSGGFIWKRKKDLVD